MQIKALKKNLEASEQGRWFEFEGNFQMKIAEMDNKAHKAATAEIAAKKGIPDVDELTRRILIESHGNRTLRRKNAHGDLNEDSKKYDESRIEAMPGTVLLDWKGLKDGDKEIPYSDEAAFLYLTDPEFIPFRNLVIHTASDGRDFTAEDIEVGKKSPASSSERKDAGSKA